MLIPVSAYPRLISISIRGHKGKSGEKSGQPFGRNQNKNHHQDTKTQNSYDKSRANLSASRFSLCLGDLVSWWLKKGEHFLSKKQESTNLSCREIPQATDTDLGASPRVAVFHVTLAVFRSERDSQCYILGAPYARRGGRGGTRRGAVMISTPGDVPGAPDDKAAARKAVEQFNKNWREAERRREAVRRLIGRFEPDTATLQVWPIILAAGKGERARESGLQVPKPLAPVLGVPAVLRVLHCFKAAFDPIIPPIVIVSPETESGVREALTAEPATFILQPLARSRELLRSPAGRARFPERADLRTGRPPSRRSGLSHCRLARGKGDQEQGGYRSL